MSLYGSANRFPHLPPVGILPTLASTKPCQGGGLDPLLSANNIDRVGFKKKIPLGGGGLVRRFFRHFLSTLLDPKLTSHVNFSNFQAKGNFSFSKFSGRLEEKRAEAIPLIDQFA